MLDIALLNTTLTPAETPGLDTLDQRFQDIAARVEAGEIEKAADDTQKLIQENVIDIRVIAYFLYGVFAQAGPAALGDICQALIGLFGPNWPAVGPANKREKHTENGVTWCLARVAKKLQAAEEAKDAEWKGWLKAFPGAAAEALRPKLDELKAAMAAVNLPSQKAFDALKPIEEWVEKYAREHAAAAPAAPEAAAEAAAEAAPGDGASSGAPAAGAGMMMVPAGAFMVEGSPHLEELQSRLRAFEVLCEKKDFPKAAVVLFDIMSTIEKFDPRLYLPKLFSSFYRLMSQNVNDLAPLLDGRESIQWKALDQHYRVDLRSFVS